MRLIAYLKTTKECSCAVLSSKNANEFFFNPEPYTQFYHISYPKQIPLSI